MYKQAPMSGSYCAAHQNQYKGSGTTAATPASGASAGGTSSAPPSPPQPQPSISLTSAHNTPPIVAPLAASIAPQPSPTSDPTRTSTLCYGHACGGQIKDGYCHRHAHLGIPTSSLYYVIVLLALSCHVMSCAS
jgi:hypothetical protein